MIAFFKACKATDKNKVKLILSLFSEAGFKCFRVSFQASSRVLPQSVATLKRVQNKTTLLKLRLTSTDAVLQKHAFPENVLLLTLV